MSATFTPWEATQVEEFLRDRKSFIDAQVNSDMGKQIVNLVFAILLKELKYNTEEIDLDKVE